MDVRSLYTNIPNREGITAVKSFLGTSAIKQLTHIITKIDSLIIFNDTNVLQTNGVSIELD